MFLTIENYNGSQVNWPNTNKRDNLYKVLESVMDIAS